MSPEGLPRSSRLTHRRDVTAVLSGGSRRRTPRLDLCWRDNELGHVRLAVVVPRHGRTAVARNRLRRRIREIARRRLVPAVGSRDLVIRSRASAYDAGFQDLAGDLEGWLHSLSS